MARLKFYNTETAQWEYVDSTISAENVTYQGGRLPEFLPVVVTQAEYDAMVEAGTINERTLYFIKEENL